MTEREVVKANIIYHTAMSETYNEYQPYFKQENVDRVKLQMQNFAEKAGRNLLLDIACGTGFMLDVAQKHFDYRVGVDVTPAMLRKAKEVSPFLCIGDVGNLPFRDGIFNVCSLYSSLHHFFTLEPTLQEVYRLLVKGGILYADEEPNFYFFRNFRDLKGDSHSSAIVAREIQAINMVSKKIKRDFGINEEITKSAEIQKLVKGGMKKELMEMILNEIGFEEVNVEYRWFLGQSRVQDGDIIEEYLRMCLPLSKNLFKYLKITATKGESS